MHLNIFFFSLSLSTITPTPTDIAKGYPTFVISILGIGLLTAFIGDFASHFGCSIGLKDSVTAIAFVALGTSVPGMLRQRAGGGLEVDRLVIAIATSLVTTLLTDMVIPSLFPM